MTFKWIKNHQRSQNPPSKWSIDFRASGKPFFLKNGDRWLKSDCTNRFSGSIYYHQNAKWRIRLSLLMKTCEISALKQKINWIHKKPKKLRCSWTWTSIWQKKYCWLLFCTKNKFWKNLKIINHSEHQIEKYNKYHTTYLANNAVLTYILGRYFGYQKPF